MKNLKSFLFFLTVVSVFVFFACSKGNDNSKYNSARTVSNVKEDDIFKKLSLILPQKIEENKPVVLKIKADTYQPLNIKIYYRKASSNDWIVASLRRINGFYQILIEKDFVTQAGIEFFFTLKDKSNSVRYFYATDENPALLMVNTTSSGKKVYHKRVSGRNIRRKRKSVGSVVKTIKHVIKKESPIREKAVEKKQLEKKQLEKKAVQETPKENINLKKAQQEAEKKKNEQEKLAKELEAKRKKIEQEKLAKQQKQEDKKKKQLVKKAKKVKTPKEILKEKGFSYSFKDFCRAIKRGKTDAVLLFLKSGMNPNQKSSKGKYPLLEAAEKNRIQIMKVLLSHGANINQKNKRGETALIKAVKRKKKKAAIFLIKHGADVSLTDKFGRNAAFYAEKKKLFKILDLLSK